jgi:hypothetical protein
VIDGQFNPARQPGAGAISLPAPIGLRKMLMAKTVRDLKLEAKALGMRGYSRLRKAELIAAIDEYRQRLTDRR